jgi:hypothetical protein
LKVWNLFRQREKNGPLIFWNQVDVSQEEIKQKR